MKQKFIKKKKAFINHISCYCKSKSDGRRYESQVKVGITINANVSVKNNKTSCI